MDDDFLQALPEALLILRRHRADCPVAARLERVYKTSGVSLRPLDQLRLPAFQYVQRGAREWSIRRTGAEGVDFACRNSAALLLGRLLASPGRAMPGSHRDADCLREFIRDRLVDGPALCPEIGRHLVVTCRAGVLRLIGAPSVEVRLLS